MPSRKIIVWGLTIVTVLAVYVFSGHTQVNPDYLKKQVAQQQISPQPEPARPPAQDLNALRTQVEQLQERVGKLEQELRDLRTPKIIPVNRQ